MGTIKQIAEYTGYSPTTVSIVLRGCAAQRNIPDSTVRVILEAARELGYQPNISARRLRSDEPLKKSIAVFWTVDFRAVLVAKFLRGAQRYIMEHLLDAELVVRPYLPERLHEIATPRTLSMYSGAIVCTAARNDLAYIEGLSTTCPLVFYNRTSEKYPYVGVDNAAVGRRAAKILLADGCRRAIAVAEHAEMDYASARLAGFAGEMKRAGLPVQVVKARDSSIAQGVACAGEFRLGAERAGAFVLSDYVALGVLRRLADEGRKVPDKIEVIGVGTNEPDLYNCVSPSLTTLEIPIEEMAYGCAGVLDALWQNHAVPAETMIPFELRKGGSTRWA
ncbi:MAG TPA: LacI family DNA-binding transcriptional regulator [Clostridia bacterium]|nr:LacI family DNA-binding transcriptional regulator [Clostridia bacterium]